MFVLGGLWYGPLFDKQWMLANSFNEADLKITNPAKQYGLSLLFAIIMAYNFAAFLGDPETDMAWGATVSFLAGFGWVMLGVAIYKVANLNSAKKWYTIAFQTEPYYNENRRIFRNPAR